MCNVTGDTGSDKLKEKYHMTRSFGPLVETKTEDLLTLFIIIYHRNDGQIHETKAVKKI